MSVADRIERDTRALCLPEGRRVGQPGHEIVRDYLRGRLTEIGLRPFAGDEFDLTYQAPHPVSGEITPFTNLVGVIPGRGAALPSLLVGAHYDSVIDAPCADDNATAVAVTLSAAEELMSGGLERDIIIALFDAEEPPFFHMESMGSTRFWKDHCAGVQLGCALIMDLVGHDVELGMPQADEQLSQLRELLFVMGAESHPALPDVVERVVPQIEDLRVLAAPNRYVGDMSDHHAFRMGGQPFLFLTCGQGRYYHHPLDTPEWINFAKVGRVCELVVALVREMDGAPLTGGAAEHDSTAFEIRMIERAMGPLLPMLLMLVGLERLEHRADLDKLASTMAGSLLSLGYGARPE